MFVVLRPGCTSEQRNRLVRAIEAAGLRARVSEDHHRVVIGVVGDEDRLRSVALEAFDGVERVVTLKKPYRLAAREFHPADSVIKIGDRAVGGTALIVMSGPCAVEEESIFQAAEAVSAAGADVLRGGVFKPRTSPYQFQGLGKPGLKLLRDAGRHVGLPVVTEAMDTRHIDLVAEYANAIQIGTRNMQNFALLKAAAATNLPVLLKRGRACTVEEWLCAAEYVLNDGNDRVILCERGLVSFDDAVRNLLDLSCVPLVKRLSHLPVVVDPSHGTGRADLVPAMARAAVAAGADGLLIEAHPRPADARSDARQALTPETLERLVPQLHAIREITRGTPFAGVPGT